MSVPPSSPTPPREAATRQFPAATRADQAATAPPPPWERVTTAAADDGWGDQAASAPPPPWPRVTTTAADDDGWGDHSWTRDTALMHPAPPAPRQTAPTRPATADISRDRRRPTPPEPGTPSGGPGTGATYRSNAPTQDARAAASSTGSRQAISAEQRAGNPFRPVGLAAPRAITVLAVLLALGVAVDKIFDVSSGLRVGLVAGSLAAILLVRLGALFAVIVTPPLAWIVGSAVELVVRAGGVPKRAQLLNYATDWLVYGFPTIAAAVVIVVLVGALRHRLRR